MRLMEESLSSARDMKRGILPVLFSFLIVVCLQAGTPSPVPGEDRPASDQTEIGQTPPRLSFTDGTVSFWRPGADDWAEAQVNTPLAPGDQLYTGSPGTMELQIGARAFVRAWATTQLGLENREPDFLQFKVTSGTATFDLRSLESGRTVEVDTPNAAFTIEHSGYYRVGVKGDRTSFIARRSGQATVIPVNGEAASVAPSEEVVVEGMSNPQIASYAAPRLDDWDKWNYARTDAVLDAVSSRYVAPGTYGAGDLDRYGSWRVVDPYGPVWVPSGVAAGWTPYSSGVWIMDPVYGWTWVDTEPWGWAPFHYGRWVMVGGFWAWAPGPLVARPVYAPALVAFFGGPFVGWVALGWGEPCIPWWGRPGFIHRPWWGGWGGPHVVNNVVISKTTVVNVRNITVFRNAGVPNAVIAVDRNRFGRGPVTRERLAHVDIKSLQPSRGAPRITASAASFVPSASRGLRPPEETLRRPVVATRAPHLRAVPGFGKERIMGTTGVPMPAPRLVPAPQRKAGASPVLPRPSFGRSTVERPQVEQALPSLPRGPEGVRNREQGVSPQAPSATRRTPPRAGQTPPVTGSPSAVPPAQPRQAEVPGSPCRTPSVAAQPPRSPALPGKSEIPSLPGRTPQAARPLSAAPPTQSRQAPIAPSPGRSLPGEPANRLAPSRMEERSLPRETRETSPRAGRPAARESGREGGGQERRGR